MKIGVFDSSWSNMGNAFFEMGLLGFLKKHFNGHEYFSLDDPAPPRTPRKDSLQKKLLIYVQIQAQRYRSKFDYNLFE